MSFVVEDGAFEGTDVWHQLRSARALFRQETPPAAPESPRTEFTAVRVSGNVTDGVFRSDEMLAELPFLRLTGDGTVNFAEANMDCICVPGESWYRTTTAICCRNTFDFCTAWWIHPIFR